MRQKQPIGGFSCLTGEQIGRFRWKLISSPSLTSFIKAARFNVISGPLAVLRSPLQVFILLPRLLLFLLILLLFLAQFLSDHVQPCLLPVVHLLFIVIMKPRLLQLQPSLLHQQEALSDALRCRCCVAWTPKILLAPETTTIGVRSFILTSVCFCVNINHNVGTKIELKENKLDLYLPGSKTHNSKWMLMLL